MSNDRNDPRVDTLEKISALCKQEMLLANRLFEPSCLIADDTTSEEIENLLKELSVMKMVGKHVNIIS